MRHGRFRMQVPERRVRTVRAISPEYEESPSARCQVLVEGLSFALGSGRRSFDDLAWIPLPFPVWVPVWLSSRSASSRSNLARNRKTFSDCYERKRIIIFF